MLVAHMAHRSSFCGSNICAVCFSILAPHALVSCSRDGGALKALTRVPLAVFLCCVYSAVSTPDVNPTRDDMMRSIWGISEVNALPCRSRQAFNLGCALVFLDLVLHEQLKPATGANAIRQAQKA